MRTSALIGTTHGACHTKPQKLYARHCATKQCLGVYLSFVTDEHLSFVTGPKKRAAAKLAHDQTNVHEVYEDLYNYKVIGNGNNCATFDKLKLFLLLPGLATEPKKNGTSRPKTILLYCVTKQCLGVYLSFVTDVHLSFMTDLPMHLDRIGTRMFRQGCHRQARGTTHRTTYETNAIFLSCRCNPECS